MSDVSCEGFLHDLVFELLEQTRTPLITHPGDYQRGYQFGLMVVLDRIKNQAETWNLSLNEIGLRNFEPERWFLSLPR